LRQLIVLVTNFTNKDAAARRFIPAHRCKLPASNSGVFPGISQKDRPAGE
jgi:hypothetical protein